MLDEVREVTSAREFLMSSSATCTSPIGTPVPRRTLRDAFVAGEISWELVDALPEPAFIARLVGR